MAEEGSSIQEELPRGIDVETRLSGAEGFTLRRLGLAKLPQIGFELVRIRCRRRILLRPAGNATNLLADNLRLIFVSGNQLFEASLHPGQKLSICDFDLFSH